MTGKCSIVLIGLAVMGENLALNIAVYNRSVEKNRAFLAGRAQGLPARGAGTLEGLAAMLEKPRKILLMVKAGQAIDDMFAALRLHLEPGDIILDGGDSFYTALAAEGINFLGVGVSSGGGGGSHRP